MSLVLSVLNASKTTGNPFYDFYIKLIQSAVAQQPLKSPPRAKSNTFEAVVLSKKTHKKIILTTHELSKPEIMQQYMEKGLVYLRRVHMTFHQSLRNPTIGCHVELLRHKEPCSYHFDSTTARKILRKQCY